MCDSGANAFLIALKFVAEWSVTNELLEKLDNSVFSNVDIRSFYQFFHDLDSNFSTIFSSDMGFSTTDLNNINLDDNFDKDDPETINHVRCMTWHNTF